MNAATAAKAARPRFGGARPGLPSVLAALAGLFALLAVAAPARAQLEVDVTEGHLDPLPIAVPDFVGSGTEEAEYGAQIAEIVANDLRSSGLFAPIDEAAFIEDIENIDLRPRFADWRVINASALLVGRVSFASDGRLLVAFRLWDTAAEQQLLGLQFVAAPDTLRRVAHKVADQVYERLTGETGYFDTRVVYVAESEGPDGEPIRRLVIMDQDGFNPRALTSRDYMALLPNFSPSAQQITYVSFRGEQAQSYLYDLETGRQEQLLAETGLAGGGQSLSARFHPDGDRLAVSIERSGGHDIFTYDLTTRALARLTAHPADDVEPSYAPDGERIVFSSTRGQNSQLYVMDAEVGAEARRITFGEGRYTAPVWSPRGDLIAFVKQHRGMFSLGVVSADGSGRERILYEGYFVDTPAWSPNGRVLLFTRGERTRNGTRYEIWSVDLAGFNLRRMPISGQSSDPAWSPLID